MLTTSKKTPLKTAIRLSNSPCTLGAQTIQGHPR
jgi:hypothetical protein